MLNMITEKHINKQVNETVARHFLRFCDFDLSTHRRLLRRATTLKENFLSVGHGLDSLRGRVLAMLFEKPSTRTRVSFEAGMAQLGGHAIMLSKNDSQMSRGEPLSDTARVLSSMCNAVMIRAISHRTIEEFATVSNVPVINGLSNLNHPCQVLADLMTFEEVRGSIEGATVCWVGAGNNICATWIEAASVFRFNLRVSTPLEYAPEESLLTGSPKALLSPNPEEAVSGADLVVTDVWVSMGEEDDVSGRKKKLLPYQVNAQLMALANKDSVFMHCLPTRRGEEVTAEVIDGEQSVVWREAENRLHAQKALLEFLMIGENFDQEEEC